MWEIGISGNQLSQIKLVGVYCSGSLARSFSKLAQVKSVGVYYSGSIPIAGTLLYRLYLRIFKK
jgi:hypothetical protein